MHRVVRTVVDAAHIKLPKNIENASDSPYRSKRRTYKIDFKILKMHRIVRTVVDATHIKLPKNIENASDSPYRSKRRTYKID